RVARQDRERHADREAERTGARGERGEAAVTAADRRGDEREDDRDRDQPDGPVREPHPADEDRRRGDEAGDRLGRTPPAGLRGARKPRRGFGDGAIGSTSRAAPSSGLGSAFTAHQTTRQRYAIGIFRTSIKKMSSHTIRGSLPPFESRSTQESGFYDPGTAR